MFRYPVKGACHCGNIQVELELSHPPSTYNPRVCDCDFCRKHGASYLSDPQGTLTIQVRDEQQLAKYRQGSEQADCLLCKTCGVLVGVSFEHEGTLFATVNRAVLEPGTRFGASQPVSPKTLSASQKAERWQSLWFKRPTILTQAVEAPAPDPTR